MAKYFTNSPITSLWRKVTSDEHKDDESLLLDKGACNHVYGLNGDSKRHSDDQSENILFGEHCHGTPGVGEVDTVARRKLIIASVLCLIFMIGEIIGGALAHSLAIMTDAAHLLTDFASFMISLFAIYLSSRPATKRMSFGWHRAEVVGALVSVLLIWVVTGILVYLAIIRVISGDFEIESRIMLITSVFGIVINVIMAVSLHNGHSHVPSVLHRGGASSGTENINVRAAFIHVLGDLVQSVGVFVAALIIYIKPKYKIADPICTFIFSILVLITTMNILKDTMVVLMEGTPKDLDFNNVKATFYNIPGVIEVHNLRMWSLTMNRTALSVHIAIDPGQDAQTILKDASLMLKHRFQISDVTIQLEKYVNDMVGCQQCQDPAD